MAAREESCGNEALAAGLDGLVGRGESLYGEALEVDWQQPCTQTNQPNRANVL